VVRARLGAGIRVELADLTPALAASLRHAASMHNPQFYEKQRMRASTWDIPRFLQFFDETVDGGLVVPRGMLTTVTELAAQAGSKLDLADERAAGTPQAFTCSAVLTGPQQAAVQVLTGVVARSGSAGRAAWNGQNRDGLRGHRRASGLHPRPGGPEDPRGPVAGQDRRVPRRQDRAARGRPGQAARLRRCRHLADPVPPRRHRGADRRVRPDRRRRMPSRPGRRVRTRGQADPGGAGSG